jgi:hypothetical protein
LQQRSAQRSTLLAEHLQRAQQPDRH